VYTLRLAFLLSLTAAAPAHALGLGDATVRSHLGEPIEIHIPVLGAAKDIDTACFNLKAGGDGLPGPGAVRIGLIRKGPETLLTISGAQRITEPALGFAVAADCPERLERRYVVLLDPPSVEPPAALPESPTPAAAAAPPPRPAAKQPLQPRRATPARIAAARGGALTHPRARPSAAPRLVLSGSRRPLVDTRDAALALRLDLDLPDLTRQRTAAPLTPTELSDENTALSRKLAHLQSQLVALERRNRELEARQKARPAESAQPPRWQSLIGGAVALLGGGIALAAWLRRRGRAVPSALDDDAWTAITPVAARRAPALEDSPMEPDAIDFAAPKAAPSFTEIEPDAGTEVKEDILDQAEVYVAFGHANLAIHLLQEHLRDAPTESPVPWLLLLDLLNREGLKAEYEATARECQRHFNINLASDMAAATPAGLGLEAYPHIVTRLQALWGTPEVEPFLHQLLYDNRGGTRLGFEAETYRDIVLLHAIARQNTLSLAA
jgi:hypothetical protein